MRSPDINEECHSSKNWRVHAVLVSVQLCFSGWHIIGSLTLSKGADPLVFATYRECVATVLMLVIAIMRGSVCEIDSGDRLRFLYLGVCSFVNVVGTLFALQLVSATRYAVMQPSIPVFATLISVFIGSEGLNIWKLAGIALAVGGAVLIEAWNSGDSGDDDKSPSDVLPGMVIIFVQCFAMANLIVFQKPLVQKYDSSWVTFVYYCIGSVVTVLMAVCWYSRFTVEDLYFSGDVLPFIALAYVSVVATMYAYNALTWAVKRAPASVVTIYNTLQPVGTVLLTLIFFGTAPTLSEGVGGVLVAAGLAITVYGRRLETDLAPVNGDAVASADQKNVSYTPIGSHGAHVHVYDDEGSYIPPHES